MNKSFVRNWINAQFRQRRNALEDKSRKVKIKAKNEVRLVLIEELGVVEEQKAHAKCIKATQRAQKKERKAKFALDNAMAAALIDSGYEDRLFQAHYQPTPSQVINDLITEKADVVVHEEFGKKMQRNNQDWEEALIMLDASTSPKKHIKVLEEIAEEFDIDLPPILT